MKIKSVTEWKETANFHENNFCFKNTRYVLQQKIISVCMVIELNNNWYIIQVMKKS